MPVYGHPYRTEHIMDTPTTYGTGLQRSHVFTGRGLSEQWRAVVHDSVKAEAWNCGHKHRTRSAAERCIPDAAAIADAYALQGRQVSA